MNIEEFKNKLNANELGKYLNTLNPILRNTVRLYQNAADEDSIAIGQTKIGGRPDLPKEITWVTETNIVETTATKYLIFKSKKQKTITKSLSFIGQINLSEVSLFDRDNILPKTGFLYFFYSAEQEAWGFDYKDNNKFKVIYWDGDVTELTRTDFPTDLPKHSCYDVCSVNIKSEVSLPSYGNEIYSSFTGDEEYTFWENVYNDDNINKLLGYSDNIQDEMELECELVTNGIYCGDSSGYYDSRVKALESNAKDWQLLLQIDSNEENKMMWGDGGRLYFWIKRDDLVNKRFDKSWFILQCS